MARLRNQDNEQFLIYFEQRRSWIIFFLGLVRQFDESGVMWIDLGDRGCGRIDGFKLITGIVEAEYW